MLKTYIPAWSIDIYRGVSFSVQAIQSLLYACKAKDIKSTSTITYLSSFTSKKAFLQQKHTSESPTKSANGNHESSIAGGNQTERHEVLLPGSPA